MRAELPAVQAKYGPNVEARVLAFPKARAAVASSTNRRIEMLVAPYDSLSINMGGVYERYEKGCFTGGLGLDIRALWNHDESCVLGRKSNGTCQVWDDAAGLHCVIPETPDTTWCRDMTVSMLRGDVDQASLSFWILSARSETLGGKRVRVITSALVRDCSVCSIAAYEQTSATVSPLSAQPLSLAVARAELRSIDHRLSDLERGKAQLEYMRLQ
jgi:HK97 family phage prohead protease